MSKKISFDFFNDSLEESIEKIAKYFKLDEQSVAEYFDSFEEPADISANNFVMEFKINLADCDNSNAEIICRHMTTTTQEGLKDIEKRGLLDLKGMLEEDTVLNRFLRNNQVEVDIQNKRILIDGKNYPITTTDEQCLLCIEEREVRCGKFEKCDIREKMDSVGRKIYDLGGTLEFFVSGTKKDMERYSVLHFNPEILETLDQLLAKIKNKTGRKEPFALSFKWREQQNEIYILQFPVSLTDIEGFCVCDYDNAYYEYEEILECCGFRHSDYLMHKVPEKVYQNLIIIRWFLATSLCGACEFGSLLSGKVIDPEKIQIVEHYNR